MTKLEDLRNRPFWDDYDEDKKFYRILYRPGFAVQARELTQSQTIFQKQIERLGDHLFKEGAMVIPGICSFDREYHFVKVDYNSNPTYLTPEAIEANILNKIIVGNTSGVKALVINYYANLPSPEIYLFVKYVSGGTDPSDLKFFNSEPITVQNTAIQFNSVVTNAIGQGTGASIKKGVYYTKGFFAVVDDQAIVVDKDSINPSCRIGLDVIISTVYPEEDETLLDNAQGTPNYAAPGAARLKIDLVLTTKDLSTVNDAAINENFIELIRLKNGIADRKVDRTAYAVLNDTLAKRTYDESGHYSTFPFLVSVKEFLNEDGNNGVYTKDNFLRDTAQEAESVGQEVLGISGSHVYSTGYAPGIDDAAFKAAARSKFVYAIEPGKAYVKGYAVETIGVTYVVSDKARTTQEKTNQVIFTNLGTFVRVTNIVGQPRVGYTVPGEESFAVVKFMDRRNGQGSVIGTARSLSLEFDSGAGNTPEANYRLYLLDVIMETGHRFDEVQSIVQDPITPDFPAGFVANTVLVEEPFLGATITKPNSGVRSVLTGSDAYWRTLDYQRLAKGDILKTSNNEFIYVVNPPTNNESLLADVTDEDGVDITGTLTTPASISRVYPVLENQGQNILLFNMPDGFIKTLAPGGSADTSYTCSQQFLSDPIAADTVTIQVLQPLNELFDTYNQTTWNICLASDGTLVSIPSSRVIFGGAPIGTQATFDLSGYSLNGEELIITAPVQKLGGVASAPKIKTLLTGNPASAWTVITNGRLDLRSVDLTRADVYNVSAIYMAPDFSTVPTVAHTNITDRYELDTGQRDMFYDLGAIRLKKTAQPPTGNIMVVYDYFSHSTGGTYFCVDSYSNIDYGDIPVYVSKESSLTYSLADVLDFRPTIGDFSGTEKFQDSPGSISFMPLNKVTADYEFYLNRQEKVYLTPEGEFLIKPGVPAVSPSLPEDPIDVMVLYDCAVRAYTANSKEVFLTMRDNRRYTMRDIGKLEKRIKSLEYYTQLSLLEKDAADLDIKDADGLDRFKNGFIVDSFTTHGVGDVTNTDYRCAIDRAGKELRPAFSEEMVHLIETDDSNGFTKIEGAINEAALRSARNYTRVGDLLMLPFDTEIELAQKMASTTLNVNPYAVFNFTGTIKMVPPLDQWKDTQVAPEPRRVNLDVGLDKALESVAKGIGILYGEWKEGPTFDGTPKVSKDQTLTGFPGPAFHIDENGQIDTSSPNDILSNLQTQMNAGQEIRRRERVIRTKQGIKERSSNRNQQKKIDNSIKGIQNEIKQLKEFQAGQFPPPRNNFPLLQTDIQSTITPVFTNRTRSKSELRVLPGTSTVETNIGESVVDVSFSEFMRSIDVTLNGKLFQPNTRLYAFFDNQPVSQFVTAGNVYNSSDNILTGTPLVTNASGECEAVFRIPAGVFTTGRKVLKLSSSLINEQNAQTSGSGIFEARGLVEKKESTILSTRVPEISRQDVGTDSETILTDFKNSIDLEQKYVDPLAQSFLLTNVGGTFLTGVDIFFSTKPTSTEIPVTVEIREMVNGYPGKKILPFSQVVMNPDDVNINTVVGAATPNADDNTDSTGTLFINGVNQGNNFTADDFLATHFEFEAPVYLEQGQEYCVVILSNSNEYEVWTAQVGQRNAGTRNPITGQPYAGSLFKSQNASTWTADQTSDLMFVLYKAQFDTNVTGIIQLSNEDLPMIALPANPFKTTAGSHIIRVNHPNHGFRNKSTGALETSKPRVQFTGIQGTDVGGISVSLLNNDLNDPTSYHRVNVLDNDNYYIEIADLLGNPIANATDTLYATGGTGIFATQNISVDVLVPAITDLSFKDTIADYSFRICSGTGVHNGQQEPYIMPSNLVNFAIKQRIELDSPAMICSLVNEQTDGVNGPVVSPATKTLFVEIGISTSNPNVSPIIDLAKCDMICVNNLVDDPGLSSVYSVIVEPTDVVLPLQNSTGLTGTATAGSNTIVFNLDPSALIHEDGYLYVVADSGEPQLRKITNISGVNVTVDKVFTQDITAQPVDTSSNSLGVSFGSSVETIVPAATATFNADGATNSITVTDDVAAGLLVSIVPGDLIKLTGGTLNDQKTLRVDRISFNPISPDVTIYINADYVVSTESAAYQIDIVKDTIKVTNQTAAKILNSVLDIGKYIEVVNSGINDSFMEVTAVNYDDSPGLENIEIFVNYDIDEPTSLPTGGVTLKVFENFYSQRNPSLGTAAAKYVTRRMVLTNPSTAAQIRFSANIQDGADVEVYVKLLRTDDTRSFDQIPYILVPQISDPKDTNDKNLFREYQFEINKLPPFVAIAAKIVMYSNDTTRPPKIKDFMMIAIDF